MVAKGMIGRCNLAMKEMRTPGYGKYDPEIKAGTSLI